MSDPDKAGKAGHSPPGPIPDGKGESDAQPEASWPLDSIGPTPATVFAPAAPAEPMPVPPEADPHTIFSSPPDPPSASEPGSASPEIGRDGWIGPERTLAPLIPRSPGKAIKIGDVLNHIFEVKRFIASGGMGQVFEGVNVSSDERVAIKVILPSLAADPNMQAMFRKEARTLVGLAHPALVQYRVLAQEPQLGVLYIVTEYIDGHSLASVLGELRPSVPELRALAIRLAEGLAAAHALGAIHRDISPENVLLEDGRLERAKIIDFGIAKNLTPGTQTIVGDGFAGKLNYVAPEQLGDFGRDVGPWSDVYSLGLVLLAVAAGREIDMGATLVDAVDRRRAGPDLSIFPEDLQPIVAKMLAGDPALRFRSMEQVIAALRGVAAPAPAAPQPAAATSGKAPRPPAGFLAPLSQVKRQWWLIAVGVAGALALAITLLTLWSGGGTELPANDSVSGERVLPNPPEVQAPALDRARVALADMPDIPCSWIDMVSLEPRGASVALVARGVARDTTDAYGAVARALAATGLPDAAINFGAVTPIEPGLCTVVDALRVFQADGGGQLAVAQPQFELARDKKGELSTDAVITLAIGTAGEEIALLGIEDGNVQPLIGSRAEFDAFVKDWPDRITQSSDGTYRLQLGTSVVGLKGVVLITAPRPIVSAPLASFSNAANDPDWSKQIEQTATRGGWRVHIIWYRVVDQVPE